MLPHTTRWQFYEVPSSGQVPLAPQQQFYKVLYIYTDQKPNNNHRDMICDESRSLNSSRVDVDEVPGLFSTHVGGVRAIRAVLPAWLRLIQRLVVLECMHRGIPKQVEDGIEPV